MRDAENAYDDDDVGGGRGGAEEYDDDVDFDEGRCTRGPGGTGVNAVAADRENWVGAAAKPWASGRVVVSTVDIDYVVDKPHETLGDRRSKGDAAVVRMFGVTGDGYSVARTCGLSRTFIAPCGEFEGGGLRRVQTTIERRSERVEEECAGVCVISVSLDRKQSLMHYSDQGSVGRQGHHGTAQHGERGAGILEKGFSVPGVRDGAFTTYPTFESNIVYALRFMVD